MVVGIIIFNIGEGLDFVRSQPRMYWIQLLVEIAQVLLRRLQILREQWVLYWLGLCDLLGLSW